MSKIGNALIEMQETEDFQFGWESAECGAPYPDWEGEIPPSARSRSLQRLGWNAYHAWEGVKP